MMGLCMTSPTPTNMSPDLYVQIYDLDHYSQSLSWSNQGEFANTYIRMELLDVEVVGLLIANGTLCQFSGDYQHIFDALHIPYYTL